MTLTKRDITSDMAKFELDELKKDKNKKAMDEFKRKYSNLDRMTGRSVRMEVSYIEMVTGKKSDQDLPSLGQSKHKLTSLSRKCLSLDLSYIQMKTGFGDHPDRRECEACRKARRYLKALPCKDSICSVCAAKLVAFAEDEETHHANVNGIAQKTKENSDVNANVSNPTVECPVCRENLNLVDLY